MNYNGQLPPQGLVRFPGISDWISCDFTFGPGIAPGVGSITLAVRGGRPQYPREFGDLVFLYNDARVVLRNCRLGSGQFSRSGSGQTVTYQILDRRWRWADGSISGRYNIRKPDGTLDGKLEPWSVKSPRELAKLCLQAMGESRYDVSALPDGPRPTVDWDHANPAQCLQSLADSLGCRVVLTLDDRVNLVKNGIGRTLPGGYLPTGGEGIDPDEKPDVLVWVAGPSRFQGPLKLRAVGLDKDLKIKPINDLSYKPKDGWENTYPGDFFEISDKKFKLPDGSESSLRALALESVYRWFQVVDEPLVWGIEKGKSENVARRRLLPLGTTLIDTYFEDDGVKRERPAYLTGVAWHPKLKDYRNTANQLLKIEKLNFSIDSEKGIVRCSDFVVQLDGTSKKEPVLYLWTAFTVQDKDTNQPLRYEKELRLNPRAAKNTTSRRILPGDGPRLDRKNIFGALGREQLSFSKSTDNQANLDAEADYYLQAAAAQFDVPASADRSYPGIIAFEPDGALAQVTWAVGVNGCTTRASITTEHDRYVPRYRDQVAAADNQMAIMKGKQAFEMAAKLGGLG